jgi:hypothetical protein
VSRTFCQICAYISPGPPDNSTSPIRPENTVVLSTDPVNHGGVSARMIGAPAATPAKSAPASTGLVAASVSK